MHLSINMKFFEYSNVEEESNKMAVGKTLCEVLTAAQEDRRLTCGLLESVTLLETDPDSVMLCVFPMDKADDVSLDIQHTLIEAFCEENDIRLMKVDSTDKLTDLLGKESTTDKPEPPRPQLDYNDNTFYYEQLAWVQGNKDFNCVLVGYPSEKCSELEADLLEYHKHTSYLIPQPIINLDV